MCGEVENRRWRDFLKMFLLNRCAHSERERVVALVWIHCQPMEERSH